MKSFWEHVSTLDFPTFVLTVIGLCTILMIIRLFS
jgi:hypothetical protein